MKVLFVGEGPHDIGERGPNQNQPRRAGGTVPALTRRICDRIAIDSIALTWAEIPRFSLSAKSQGFQAKLSAAALLATRRFDCVATVAVADCDRNAERAAQLQEGADRARAMFPKHPTVWGLAIESIEAWTLGAPEALAEELGISPKSIEAEYPAGIKVEALYENSGKPDHRPKALIERIAQLKHRHDSAEFRAAVAARTDVVRLASVCPEGFAPFAERIRKEF